MSDLLRRGAVPAFILTCMILGGSAQGIWSNAAIQLLAVILIAGSVIARRPDRTSRAPRLLLLLAAALIAAVVLQLIPLPAEIGRQLPGREVIAAGYSVLGYDLPDLPLSWSPADTMEAGYRLLPPVAVLVALTAVRGQKDSWVAGTILAGALASVLLAAVQVGGAGGSSWAYLYRYTNTGAVGFFANRNHMASLLVIAIPFAAAMYTIGHEKLRGRGRSFAMLAVGGGGFLLILVGLLLNASLAAFALAAPVVVASALILPAGWRRRRLLLPLAAIAIVGCVVALTGSSMRSQLAGAPDLGSVYSRSEMWGVTLGAIKETFPAGTGVGTFAKVYALHENPGLITPTYVNHAHNDYLEVVLEMGLLGVVLLAAFAAWWLWRAVSLWRTPFSSPFAKAATVASGAVLAHSLVDYPLRTAAIAAAFAACAAMMAESSRERERAKPRHVTIA